MVEANDGIRDWVTRVLLPSPSPATGVDVEPSLVLREHASQVCVLSIANHSPRTLVWFVVGGGRSFSASAVRSHDAKGHRHDEEAPRWSPGRKEREASCGRPNGSLTGSVFHAFAQTCPHWTKGWTVP